jgi:hypothetical protein
MGTPHIRFVNTIQAVRFSGLGIGSGSRAGSGNQIADAQAEFRVTPYGVLATPREGSGAILVPWTNITYIEYFAGAVPAEPKIATPEPIETEMPRRVRGPASATP